MARSRLLVQGGLFDPVRESRVSECEHCCYFGRLFWSPTGSVAEGAYPGYWLCEHCDEEHQDYWTDMWDDYYGGLL
jgi:hypothetical protein